MEKRKPRGWKGNIDDYWYTRERKYGMQYMYSECRRVSDGIWFGGGEVRMHWPDCPRRLALEEEGAS